MTPRAEPTRWTRGRSHRQIAFDLFVISAAYAGGCLLLFVLGLAVNGYRGWLVIATPWVVWMMVRAITDLRVAVQLGDDGVLRYEARRPRDDLEVELDAVRAFRREPLARHVLILELRAGGAHALRDLSPEVTDEVAAWLDAHGIDEVR